VTAGGATGGKGSVARFLPVPLALRERFSRDVARKRAHFDDADLELSDVLESLDDAVNYRDWICGLAEPHLSSPVLEIGAGHGTMTEVFAAGFDVVAVEPSERAGKLLLDRFAEATVELVVGYDTDIETSRRFGSIVMINVLEHVDDDDGLLRRCLDRLEPGGRLCIWVPGFPSLYSHFDAKVGHYRRYTKRQASAQLRSAGFRITEARYVNVVGFLGWWAVVKVLRRNPTSGEALRTIDQRITPVLRKVESRVPVPFGQSLFIVAERPETALG
jgi:SAM-dependent methyltransferase